MCKTKLSSIIQPTASCLLLKSLWFKLIPAPQCQLRQSTCWDKHTSSESTHGSIRAGERPGGTLWILHLPGRQHFAVWMNSLRVFAPRYRDTATINFTERSERWRHCLPPVTPSCSTGGAQAFLLVSFLCLMEIQLIEALDLQLFLWYKLGENPLNRWNSSK